MKKNSKHTLRLVISFKTLFQQTLHTKTTQRKHGLFNDEIIHLKHVNLCKIVLFSLTIKVFYKSPFQFICLWLDWMFLILFRLELLPLIEIEPQIPIKYKVVTLRLTQRPKVCSISRKYSLSKLIPQAVALVTEEWKNLADIKFTFLDWRLGILLFREDQTKRGKMYELWRLNANGIIMILSNTFSRCKSLRN